MLKLILMSLYLFLPAFVANAAPVLFKKLNFLAYPVDFKKKFRGRRIFGSHKTWRGVLFGIIMGIVIVYLQKLVYVFPTFKWLSILDYNKVNLLLLGFLLGLGAMIGDVVGSFFKRQVNIAPGKPWLPFDQTDFILGGLLLMLFVYVPSWQTTLIILVLGFILHILFNLASYSLGFQKNML